MFLALAWEARAIRVAVAAALFTSGIGHAAPPDIWKNGPVTEATVAIENLAIENGIMQLPALLRPAAEFQKVLLQIRAGADPATWRAPVDRAAQNAGGDSVTVALRELAKCWQARLAEVEIDKALRKFYRMNVRFPDHLDEVRADIPESLRLDPWGQPWIYKTIAPEGFAKLDDQRYELGPTRYPQLTTLATAIKDEPAAPAWKITPREVSGGRALEIRTAAGQVAGVQPGVQIEGTTLAYIADGWALFANTDGLFVQAF
jgi:hypothetical protein